MIGGLALDYFRSLRAPVNLVIHQRELERRFNRLRAARGEEETSEARRSPLREPLDQALALRRRPYRDDVIDAAHFLGDELCDFFATLPDVGHHGACRRVEDFPAVGGVEPGALGVVDEQRLVGAANERQWERG